MPGNSAFELVNERGWQRGLSNMLRNEMGLWLKTRRWWVNSLRWAVIIGLMLSTIVFQTPGKPPPSDGVAALYAILAGMIPAIAVIIMMQGAVVGEKENGTAAWVLSKPVTRPAFMLSKLIANSLGVLVTMVVPPGVVAYMLYAVVSGTPWNPIAFLSALGVIFLFNIFYLSLTLMLGTFFSSRGPVIGIALALLLGQQLLVGVLPSLGYILPWNLIITTGEQMNAVVPCLLLGSHNYSVIPILVGASASIFFVLVGLYRFNHEEL
jgi:ABC-2 type transport system permease protein